MSPFASRIALTSLFSLAVGSLLLSVHAQEPSTDETPAVVVRENHVTLRTGELSAAALWRLAVRERPRLEKVSLSPEFFAAKIHLAAGVEDAPLEVVLPLLEANGWKAHADDTLKRDASLAGEDLQTIALRARSPLETVKALRRLVDLDTKGRTRSGVPFRSVAAEAAGYVVVASSADLVEYAAHILKLWCNPGPSVPNRVIEVRRVDVEKLAEVMESVLALWRLDDAPGRGDPQHRSRVAVIPDRRSGRLVVGSSDTFLLDELEKLAGFLDRDPRHDKERPAAATEILPAPPSLQGKRVDILEGDIPVSEFLRFLADYKGIPVILDDRQHGSDTTITVAAPIRRADDAIVQALLEANGWLVQEQSLPGGKRVLKVVHGNSAPPSVPQPRPIIRVKRRPERQDSAKRTATPR